MNALIIYAHPEEKSFTYSLTKELEDSLKAKGHNTNIRDLYALSFNPVLSSKDLEMINKGCIPEDIKIEQEYITWADTLFFVFPTWWESMPAIMRGYIDRVFSYGFAYGGNENGDIGLLKGKKGVFIQGAGASKETFEATGLKNAIDIVHNTGILEFCGVEPAGHLIFNSVSFVSNEERVEMIKSMKKFINNNF